MHESRVRVAARSSVHYCMEAMTSGRALKTRGTRTQVTAPVSGLQHARRAFWTRRISRERSGVGWSQRSGSGLQHDAGGVIRGYPRVASSLLVESHFDKQIRLLGLVPEIRVAAASPSRGQGCSTMQQPLFQKIDDGPGRDAF